MPNRKASSLPLRQRFLNFSVAPSFLGTKRRTEHRAPAGPNAGDVTRWSNTTTLGHLGPNSNVHLCSTYRRVASSGILPPSSALRLSGLKYVTILPAGPRGGSAIP